MKYTRSNKKNREHYYLGGTSFDQKGVAAQLRSSMPHNSVLRKKLNEIVHSGDFYESKERNSFLDLNNDSDIEAQEILSEAVDYIKNNKDLSAKIKKRVLQGIVPIASTTTRTDYHKTSTKKMKTRTPTKTNRTSTVTNTIFRNRSRMRTKKMYKK